MLRKWTEITDSSRSMSGTEGCLPPGASGVPLHHTFLIHAAFRSRCVLCCWEHVAPRLSSRWPLLAQIGLVLGPRLPPALPTEGPPAPAWLRKEMVHCGQVHSVEAEVAEGSAGMRARSMKSLTFSNGEKNPFRVRGCPPDPSCPFYP